MKYFFIIILMAGLTQCANKKTLAPDAYMQYLNSSESGLMLSKEYNQISYKLKMQPAGYLAIANSGASIKTQADFKASLNNYKEQMNFILLIQDAEKSNHRVKSMVFNKQEYGTILAYANTDLKNDIVLIQERDTLYCRMLHLESANSLQPILRLSLSFNGINANAKEFTLILNDNIFNNGPIKFYYSKKVMENLPDLKL